MTPLGHISSSYIAGAYFRRNAAGQAALPALIIGGVLPDMDFLFFLFDWFNRVHRVITHNLLFVVSAALIGMVFFGKESRKTAALCLAAGGLLHLAIDACMDNNPTNGIGIAFLWPFSDGFYSPFNLLTPNTRGIGWDQPFRMVRLMMPLLLYEVPLYVLALSILFRRTHRSRNSCADGT